MKYSKNMNKTNVASRRQPNLKVIVGGFSRFSVWVAIFVFVVVQIFITIQTTSAGAKLVDLEEKVKSLQLENRRLSEELVHNTSLTDVEKSANELGFKKPDNTLFINSNDFVAKIP